MKFDGDSIKVYLILFACLVVGIGSFFVLSTIPALVVLAICIYVAYVILKIVAKAFNARITTYTEIFILSCHIIVGVVSGDNHQRS